ncbi:hypothetical protein BC833DRAFT_589981, partial [Globomyces pollinis-pini]
MFRESNNTVNVLIPLQIVRSKVSQLFCLFIFTSMWILSISAIILSTTLWMRRRTVEAPTIGVVGCLLFALPAIRNSQPGAPSIGSTIDCAGFFWNMFLVELSMLLLLWNYIIKKQADIPVEKKVTESTSIDIRCSQVDSESRSFLPRTSTH